MAEGYPYPAHYVSTWTMRDGRPVTIRPIRTDDAPLLLGFHCGLSTYSVYQRYFHAWPLASRIAHERLAQVCWIDYEHEMVLVIEQDDPEISAHLILAVGQLIPCARPDEAEFSIVVRDQFQGRGLGTAMLLRLIEIGRARRLRRLVAEIMTDNTMMLNICRRYGFRLQRVRGEPLVEVSIDLA
jgi:acetyltransferase